MLALLISTLVLGLSAGLHCIFMCGPLAAALPLGGLGKAAAIRARLIFMGGRWLVYVLMGAMAGSAGHSLSWTGLQLPFVYVLLLLLVLLAGSWNFDWAKSIREGLRKRALGWRESNFTASFLLLGMANGLLPCGMVYAALAQSVLAATALHGAAMMLVFGLFSSWWQYLLLLGWRPAVPALFGLKYLASPRAGLVILSFLLAFRLWEMVGKSEELPLAGAHKNIICRPQSAAD